MSRRASPVQQRACDACEARLRVLGTSPAVRYLEHLGHPGELPAGPRDRGRPSALEFGCVEQLPPVQRDQVGLTRSEMADPAGVVAAAESVCASPVR